MAARRILALIIVGCGLIACTTSAVAPRAFLVQPNVSVPVRNYVHIENPDITCDARRVSELRYRGNGLLEICDGEGSWRTVTVAPEDGRP